MELILCPRKKEELGRWKEPVCHAKVQAVQGATNILNLIVSQSYLQLEQEKEYGLAVISETVIM